MLLCWMHSVGTWMVWPRILMWDPALTHRRFPQLAFGTTGGRRAFHQSPNVENDKGDTTRCRCRACDLICGDRGDHPPCRMKNP